MRDLNQLVALAPTGIAAPGYEYLLNRGVPAESLDALVSEFDLRFDDEERRVVFPVREAGKDVGYAARSIDPQVRKRWRDWPVEGAIRTTVYQADRVQLGGDTLFVVEGPFDALMVTAAIQPGNGSVATAFFGSLPTAAQLGYITAAIPLFRMVYMMLDANVYGRCRRLAQELALAASAPNVGSINIGIEHRDPGATRFEELEALVEFASTSWQTEIRWMWERRLVFTGGAKE
ncbi:MAG: hypothetical protein U1D55_13830 [Phycisphaerae bacterium]